MIQPAAILSALLALPPYAHDPPESAADRQARLSVVADAIADAARNRVEAATLIALVKHEAAGSLLVQSGRCSELPRGQRCDNGKARGLFQLHLEACRAAFELPEGSAESIRVEAGCAIRLLRWNAERGREHAISPLHAAFAGYGARAFNWRGADARVATVKAILKGWRA